MRIGLAQIDMGFEEKENAMALCREMIVQGAAQGVTFMVFPEMTLTGFTMKTKELCEALEYSPTLAFFQKEAKENNMTLCFGLPVEKDGMAENHCIIVDENGKVLADYAKIHPFSFGTEADYYIGGDLLVSCSVKGIPVAPFICYDLRFPEIFQITSKNSLVLTVIANWPTPRREHWMVLLKARAIENQAFVIGVNRSGKGGGLEYSGDSMVISPLGEILAHAKKGHGLTVVEIDPQEALQYRESFPVKMDRKPDLYERLRKRQQEERSPL